MCIATELQKLSKPHVVKNGGGKCAYGLGTRIGERSENADWHNCSMLLVLLVSRAVGLSDVFFFVCRVLNCCEGTNMYPAPRGSNSTKDGNKKR